MPEDHPESTAPRALDPDEMDRLRRRLVELEVYQEVAKALTSSLEPQRVLEQILEQVRRVLRPGNWSLLLRDERSGELEFAIAEGTGAEKLRGLRLGRGEGIAGSVAESGEPLLISEVDHDPRWSARADELTRFHTRSVVCVPMICRDEVRGVIELVNFERARRFDAIDLRLLQTFADFAAIALENARHVQALRDLSLSDDVTVLRNARYLHRVLPQELEAAREARESFSLVLFDLDRFKSVNDRHGHLEGSAVLRELGDLIAPTLPPRASGVRYGGDEFVILLPGHDPEAAASYASMLREAVKGQVFRRESGANIRLTASYGLCGFPRDAQDARGLLALADALMYGVKERGRDGLATSAAR
ncbi:MAG: sensor domain-containing diguanylate cyclase [Planctomycetes bacterium]|nr:sensor domain-containing diguanylate cyclase [Planctomycetota bacterium]